MKAITVCGARKGGNQNIDGSGKHRFILSRKNRSRKISLARHKSQRYLKLSTGPNRAYVSDITYIRTGAGWLYLAIVMDLYGRH